MKDRGQRHNSNSHSAGADSPGLWVGFNPQKKKQSLSDYATLSWYFEALLVVSCPCSLVLLVSGGLGGDLPHRHHVWCSTQTGQIITSKPADFESLAYTSKLTNPSINVTLMHHQLLTNISLLLKKKKSVFLFCIRFYFSSSCTDWLNYTAALKHLYCFMQQSLLFGLSIKY